MCITFASFPHAIAHQSECIGRYTACLTLAVFIDKLPAALHLLGTLLWTHGWSDITINKIWHHQHDLTPLLWYPCIRCTTLAFLIRTSIFFSPRPNCFVFGMWAFQVCPAHSCSSVNDLSKTEEHTHTHFFCWRLSRSGYRSRLWQMFNKQLVVGKRN